MDASYWSYHGQRRAARGEQRGNGSTEGDGRSVGSRLEEGFSMMEGNNWFPTEAQSGWLIIEPDCTIPVGLFDP